MIIVTGSAGFIGSNIVKRLSKNNKVLSVDYTDPRERFSDLTIESHITPEELISDLDRLTSISSVVVHQGANTCTTDHSVKMFEQNFDFTKKLVDSCLVHDKRIIYASSAAVYGSGTNGFNVSRECEQPLNIYGFSKLLVDDYVRSLLDLGLNRSQIVGMRYFNVYGPGEEFKGNMASTIFHFFNQSNTGKIKPFKGSGNFFRDFIYVKDVVEQVMYYIENDNVSGIFNCGTGRERSFLEVAKIVSERTGASVESIEFPEKLKRYYQNFTKADMKIPHDLGTPPAKTCLEEGIKDYIENYLLL